MIATLANRNVPGLRAVNEPAFVAGAHATASRSNEPATPFLVQVVHWLGQVLERRQHAAIARRDSPLSLDDAWAGGWYARSRMLQDALQAQQLSASAKPAPRLPNWDDRLD